MIGDIIDTHLKEVETSATKAALRSRKKEKEHKIEDNRIDNHHSALNYH
jgi:hypothetical protein